MINPEGVREVINCLRKSPSELLSYADGLKELSKKSEHTYQRKYERVSYTNAKFCTLEIIHPGGSNVIYEVMPVEMSRNSMSLIHGNFLHTGTDCNIEISRLDHGTDNIKGKVYDCRHIENHIHQIVITFESLVNLADYIEGAKNTPVQNNEAIKHYFKGSIFHADMDIDMQEVMRYHLEEMGIIVTTTAGEEIDKSSKINNYSLIIIDEEVASGSGFRYIHTIRESGYEGPIIATTSADSDDVEEKFIEAGANMVLPKPYTLAEVVPILGMYLKSVAGPNQPKVLESEFWDNESMRDLIIKFLKRIEERIDVIESHYQNNDMEGFSRELIKFKSPLSNYGYPQIVDTIDLILRLTENESKTAEIHSLYSQLCMQCSAAKHYVTEKKLDS